MRRAALRFLAAFAAVTAAAPALADEAVPPDRTLLHLTQSAERTVTRDQLDVDLRVEATGGDPRVVQAEVNRRMTAALAKAKASPSVKVRTGNYDTYQVTPTNAEGKPKGPPQWRTTQGLSLSGRDFDAALGLAGDLEGQGLLIDGMRFEVSIAALRALEDELTSEVLARLKDRAGKIAAAMGMHVANYRDLNVGNAEEGGGGRMMPLMARAATGPAPPPAAEAGEAIVTIKVNGEILLAPGS